MKNTQEAFKWIIKLLRKKKIDFQITGGLAAKIYGSTRKLADIDIEIANADFAKIIEDVKNYLTYGPARYKDDEFDLLLMKIEYQGQKIDICGVENQKLFNKQNKIWDNEKIVLKNAQKKKIYGYIVPVIKIEELIDYKKKIARAVDIEDIKFLEKNIT